MSWRYSGPCYDWGDRYYQNNNPASNGQYNQRERARYDPRTKPLFQGRPSSNYRPGKPIVTKHVEKQNSATKPGSKTSAQAKSSVTPTKSENNQSCTKNADTKPSSSQIKAVPTPSKAGNQSTSTNKVDNKPTDQQTKPTKKTENQPSSTKNADNKPTSSPIKAVATPQKASDQSTSTNKAENNPTTLTKPVLTTQKTENQPSSTKNVHSKPTSNENKPTAQTKPIVTTEKTDSQQMSITRSETKPTPLGPTVSSQKNGHGGHFNCCSYINKPVSKSTVSQTNQVFGNIKSNIASKDPPKSNNTNGKCIDKTRNMDVVSPKILTTKSDDKIESTKVDTLSNNNNNNLKDLPASSMNANAEEKNSDVLQNVNISGDKVEPPKTNVQRKNPPASNTKEKFNDETEEQLNKVTVQSSNKKLLSKKRENELPISQVDKMKKVESVETPDDDFMIVFESVKTNNASKDPPKSSNTKEKSIAETQNKDGVSPEIATTKSDDKIESSNVNTPSNTNNSKDTTASSTNETTEVTNYYVPQDVQISGDKVNTSKANVQSKDPPASNTKEKCNDKAKDKSSVVQQNMSTSNGKEESTSIGCLKVKNMTELLKNGGSNLLSTSCKSIGSQQNMKPKVAVVKPVNIVNPNKSSVGRPIPTITNVTSKHVVSLKIDSRPSDSNHQLVSVPSIPNKTIVPNHTMNSNNQPCGSSQKEQPVTQQNKAVIPPACHQINIPNNPININNNLPCNPSQIQPPFNNPNMNQWVPPSDQQCNYSNQINFANHQMDMDNHPPGAFPDNNPLNFPIQPRGPLELEPPSNIQNQGSPWPSPQHPNVSSQFTVPPTNIQSHFNDPPPDVQCQFNGPPPHFLHPHFGNPPTHENNHAENNVFCSPYRPFPFMHHSSDYQWPYNSSGPYQDQQYNSQNETTPIPIQYVQHSNYPTRSYTDYPPNLDVHPASGDSLHNNALILEGQQSFSNNVHHEPSGTNTTNAGSSIGLPRSDQKTNTSSTNENSHQCPTSKEWNKGSNNNQEVNTVVTDTVVESIKDNNSSKTNPQSCPESNVNFNKELMEAKEPTKPCPQLCDPDIMRSTNDISMDIESQDVILIGELHEVCASQESSDKPDATKSNDIKTKEQHRSKTRSPEGTNSRLEVLKNKTSFELSKQIMQTMHTLQGQIKGIGLEKDFKNLLENFYGKIKSDFHSLEKVKENRLDDENIALMRLNRSVTTLSNEVTSIKSKSYSPVQCRDEDILFPLASEICPNQKGDQDVNSRILSTDKKSAVVIESKDNQDGERTQGKKSIDDQILDFLSAGLQKFQQRNTNVYDRLHKSAHANFSESCSSRNSPMSEISSANSCYSNDGDSRSGLQRKTRNLQKFKESTRKSPSRAGWNDRYPQGDPPIKYRNHRERSSSLSPRRLSAKQIYRRSISPQGSRPLYDRHVRDKWISRNTRHRISLSRSRSKSPIKERRSRHYVRRSLSRSLSRSPVRKEQKSRRNVELLPLKISANSPIRDGPRSWRPLRRSLSRSRSRSPMKNDQILRRRDERSLSRSCSRSPLRRRDKFRHCLRRSLTRSSSRSPIRSEQRSRRRLRRSLSRSSSRSPGLMKNRSRFVKRSLSRSSSKSPIRNRRVTRNVRRTLSRSSSRSPMRNMKKTRCTLKRSLSRNESKSPIRSKERYPKGKLNRSLSRNSSTSSVQNDQGECKQIGEKPLSISTSRRSRSDGVKDKNVPCSNDVSPSHTKISTSYVPKVEQKSSITDKRSASPSPQSSREKSVMMRSDMKPKRKRNPIVFSPEKSRTSPISLSPSPERVYSSFYPQKDEEDDDDILFRKSTNSGFDLRSKIKSDLRPKQKRRVSPDTIYDKKDLYVKAKGILIERKVDQRRETARALDKQKTKYSKNLEDLDNYFRIRNKLHQGATGPLKSSETSVTSVAPTEINRKMDGEDDINESVDDVLKYMEDHLEFLFNDDDGNSSKDVHQLDKPQSSVSSSNLNTSVNHNISNEIEEGEIKEPEEGEIEEDDLRDILNLIKLKKGITRTSLGDSEKHMLLLEAKTYLQNKLIQIGIETSQNRADSDGSNRGQMDVRLEYKNVKNQENIVKHKAETKELEAPIELPCNSSMELGINFLPNCPQISDTEKQGHESDEISISKPNDMEDIEMKTPKKKSDSNGTENNDEDDFNFIEGILADIDDIFENVEEGDKNTGTSITVDGNSIDESDKLESNIEFKSSERHVEQNIQKSPEKAFKRSADNAKNDKKTHKNSRSNRGTSEKNARKHNVNERNVQKSSEIALERSADNAKNYKKTHENSTSSRCTSEKIDRKHNVNERNVQKSPEIAIERSADNATNDKKTHEHSTSGRRKSEKHTRKHNVNERNVQKSPETTLESSTGNTTNEKKANKNTSSSRTSEKTVKNHNLNDNIPDNPFNRDIKWNQRSSQQVKGSKDLKDDVLDSLAENEMNMIKRFVHGIDTGNHVDKKLPKKTEQCLNENKEQSKQNVTVGHLENLTDGNVSKEKPRFCTRKYIDETNIPFLECSDINVEKESRTPSSFDNTELNKAKENNFTQSNAGSTSTSSTPPSDSPIENDLGSKTSHANLDAKMKKQYKFFKTKNVEDLGNVLYDKLDHCGDATLYDLDEDKGSKESVGKKSTTLNDSRNMVSKNASEQKPTISKSTPKEQVIKPMFDVKHVSKAFCDNSGTPLSSRLTNTTSNRNLSKTTARFQTRRKIDGRTVPFLESSDVRVEKEQTVDRKLTLNTRTESFVEERNEKDKKSLKRPQCSSRGNNKCQNSQSSPEDNDDTKSRYPRRSNNTKRISESTSEEKEEDDDDDNKKFKSTSRYPRRSNNTKRNSESSSEEEEDEESKKKSTSRYPRRSNNTKRNSESMSEEESKKKSTSRYPRRSNNTKRNSESSSEEEEDEESKKKALSKLSRRSNNTKRNSESMSEEEDDKESKKNATSRYPRRSNNTKRKSESSSQEEENDEESKKKFNSTSRYPRRSNLKRNSESIPEKDKEDECAAKRPRYSFRNNIMTGESDKEERTDKRSSISKGLKHSSTNTDLIQDSRGKESEKYSNREKYPLRSNVHLENIKSGSEGKEETKSTERKRYPRRSNVSHVSFAELDSDIEALSDDSSASEKGNSNTSDSKNKKHSLTIKKSQLEPSTKNEYQNKSAESKDEKNYSKMNSEKDQQSCPKLAVQSNEQDKGDNRIQKSAKGYSEEWKRWERVGSGNIWKVQPVNNATKCETEELGSKTLPGSTNSDKGKPSVKQVSMITPSTTKEKPSSSQNTSDQQMSSRKPNIRTTRAK